MSEAPVKVSTVRPATPSTLKKQCQYDLLDIAEDLEIQRELLELLDDSDYENAAASKECKTNNQLFGVESDEDTDKTKHCDSPVRHNEGRDKDSYAECKTNNQLFGVESDEDTDKTKHCDSPVRHNEGRDKDSYAECKTNNQLFGVESDEDTDKTKHCDSPVRQNEGRDKDSSSYGDYFRRTHSLFFSSP